MRQLASFLLIALAVPAAAADVWRWKDADGVHYSDQPVPGAERVSLAVDPTGTAAPAPQVFSPAPPQRPVEEFRYSGCVVLAPANDTTFHAVDTVNVSLQITPALQADHRMQVLLDGSVHAAWPGRSLNYTLTEIHRGSHTLSVQILDAQGRSLCAGPVVAFHVQQPTLYSPARRPQAVPHRP